MQLIPTKNSKLVFVTALIAIVITLASWSIPLTPGMFTEFFYPADTLPQNCDSKITRLNEALNRLEKAKTELNERDIAKEVTEALQQANLQQVQANVEKAVANASIALKNVDMEQIKQQVEEALAKIDMKKINEQVKTATQNLQPQIEQSLKEARIQIEKAQKEIEEAKQKIRQQ